MALAIHLRWTRMTPLWFMLLQFQPYAAAVQAHRQYSIVECHIDLTVSGEQGRPCRLILLRGSWPAAAR